MAVECGGGCRGASKLVEDIKCEVEGLQFILAGRSDPPRKTYLEPLLLEGIFSSLIVIKTLQFYGWVEGMADFEKIHSDTAP